MLRAPAYALGLCRSAFRRDRFRRGLKPLLQDQSSTCTIRAGGQDRSRKTWVAWAKPDRACPWGRMVQHHSKDLHSRECVQKQEPCISICQGTPMNRPSHVTEGCIPYPPRGIHPADPGNRCSRNGERLLHVCIRHMMDSLPLAKCPTGKPYRASPVPPGP